MWNPDQRDILVSAVSLRVGSSGPFPDLIKGGKGIYAGLARANLALVLAIPSRPAPTVASYFVFFYHPALPLPSFALWQPLRPSTSPAPLCTHQSSLINNPLANVNRTQKFQSKALSLYAVFKFLNDFNAPSPQFTRGKGNRVGRVLVEFGSSSIPMGNTRSQGVIQPPRRSLYLR